MSGVFCRSTLSALISFRSSVTSATKSSIVPKSRTGTTSPTRTKNPKGSLHPPIVLERRFRIGAWNLRKPIPAQQGEGYATVRRSAKERQPARPISSRGRLGLRAEEHHQDGGAFRRGSCRRSRRRPHRHRRI